LKFELLDPLAELAQNPISPLVVGGDPDHLLNGAYFLFSSLGGAEDFLRNVIFWG